MSVNPALNRYTKGEIEVLREVLADVLYSIPHYEWAVRVAQAKLVVKKAELNLARERDVCVSR